MTSDAREAVCGRVLDGELAAVRGELARLDGKCSTLTAVIGAVMAILASQIGRTAVPVRVVLAAAGVPLAAAAVVLLVGVLRPRLGSSGFCRWAAMTPREIGRMFELGWHDFADDDRLHVRRVPSDDLHFLSRLALTKQARLQRAVDLLVVGLVLVGIALVVGVVA